MPKKRNNSWIRTRKEKQKMTARLIEISMKVDDYVYKQTSISEYDAKEYIKEVCSYKKECERDERSLQVIEKLIRCMKAIILEHEELKTGTDNTNLGSYIPGLNIRADTVSPVYSLSDEDRTQLMQVTDSTAENITEANAGYSDIVDDDIDTEFTHNPTNDVSSRMNIHRAMSSLSLKEIKGMSEIPSTNVECSQSILKNFDDIENLEQRNKIPIASGESAVSVVPNNNDSIVQRTKSNLEKYVGDNLNKKHIIDAIQNKLPLLFIKSNEIWKPAVTNTPNITFMADNTYKIVIQNKERILHSSSLNTFNIKSTDKSAIHLVTKPIKESQDQRCYVTDKNWTVNNPNCVLKDLQLDNAMNANPIKIKEPVKSLVDVPKNNPQTMHGKYTINSKESSTTSLNNKPISDTINADKNPIITKNKRVPRKKKIVEINEINTKNMKKTKSRVKKPKKDTNIPIYNKSVENDLSWLENIRYVREIKADENDLKLHLDEAFWDNIYLPANWDDSEFM